MASLPFTAFKELCELNRDKKYVQELLELITYSDCHPLPGIVQPQPDMASLYKLRLEIAKEKGTRDAVYINDFENTVLNMQNSKSEKVGITWLQSELYSYLIFYEPTPPAILGILKVNASSNAINL